MLLKSVFIGFLSFSILHADILKECKTEEDIISGCAERYYYKNGNLASETPYKNGKEEGIEKWYYENGNLNIETPYKNGKEEGIEKWYYWNGSLRTETPYKNGKVDGIARWYYDNGNLVIEVSYKNYELHGDLKYYTEDGKLLALVKAENGSITSGKCFNDKVLTDKEIDEININDIEKAINYLQKICLKESDSK